MLFLLIRHTREPRKGRERERGADLESQHNHGQRISNQHHFNARQICRKPTWKVMRRDHGNGCSLLVQAPQSVDGHLVPLRHRSRRHGAVGAVSALLPLHRCCCWCRADGEGGRQALRGPEEVPAGCTRRGRGEAARPKEGGGGGGGGGGGLHSCGRATVDCQSFRLLCTAGICRSLGQLVVFGLSVVVPLEGGGGVGSTGPFN